MVMTSDKTGQGVKWFFLAVLLFLVVYFHKVLWAILETLYKVLIEPRIGR